MKRIISIAAAAVIALSLAGCNKEDKQVGNKKSRSWRVVSSYDTTEYEKNGMFVVEQNDSLSFMDLSTMEEAPLCDDPTCKHQSGTCNSFGKCYSNLNHTSAACTTPPATGVLPLCTRLRRVRRNNPPWRSL